MVTTFRLRRAEVQEGSEPALTAAYLASEQIANLIVHWVAAEMKDIAAK